MQLKFSILNVTLNINQPLIFCACF